jgi:hypothetical protein
MNNDLAIPVCLVSAVLSFAATDILVLQPIREEHQRQQALTLICKTLVQTGVVSSCRPLDAKEREESKWTTYYP